MRQVFFICLFIPLFATAQQNNELKANPFTNPAIFQHNTFITDSIRTETFPVQVRKTDSKEYLFWLLAALLLLLACLKFFYARYFQTLFRVFFNTSLRQSQLTDQLRQAKLPSLMFNIFFFISTGIYIYLLAMHYKVMPVASHWLFLLLSVITAAAIYSLKTVILKFAGWITSSGEMAGSYVFVVFLINKIIGIVLVPFLVLLAFAESRVSIIVATVSFFLLLLLFFLRFFKSYGLFQNRLAMSRFHFFILIAALEIVPLLVIYKSAMILLDKNL